MEKKVWKRLRFIKEDQQFVKNDQNQRWKNKVIDKSIPSKYDKKK